MRTLSDSRDRLSSAMPGSHARHVEADAEAMLKAYGFASRPGPKSKGAADFLAMVVQALRGPHQLTVIYAGGRGPQRPRLLEPLGLLLVTRRYLVAREASEDGRLQHFRLDRLMSAQLEANSFQRAAGFDLAEHATRAFGSYHADQEYGVVGKGPCFGRRVCKNSSLPTGLDHSH